MFSPIDLVASLGLGGQMVTAATLLLVAVYVYRAIGVARLVTGVVSTVTREVLVLLVAAAVVIGLGWASPNSALVWEHVRALWAFLSERGVGVVRRAWRVVSGFV